MYFDKGKMPPAKGFWSPTMYDASFSFVANPLNRYTLSARNELKTNPDGSVDPLIQHESRARAKNLTGCRRLRQFVLMVRLYWTSETPPSLLDGSWTFPAVKKAR